MVFRLAMAGLCSIMSDTCSSFDIQPFILLFLSFLFTGLLMTNFHYYRKLRKIICSGKAQFHRNFDYGINKGPHKWKELFPASRGCYQSPVNIRTDATEVLRISEPLLWTCYDDLPVKVFIENTGHTVDLQAEYSCNKPTISGADLMECYTFVSLCFRWSILDGEGSEHTINDRKYPMEMQAIHMSKENTPYNLIQTGDLGILVLSYFFTITKYDNPYLDPIILHLHLIREPGKRTELPPFPLSWLCYPFRSGFYSYGGSLTEPPCSEGVTWFLQPEPMSISEKQLAQFRSLLSNDGAVIMRNSRPVQEINSRVICYNRFDQYQGVFEGEEDVRQGQPMCL